MYDIINQARIEKSKESMLLIIITRALLSPKYKNYVRMHFLIHFFFSPCCFSFSVCSVLVLFCVWEKLSNSQGCFKHCVSFLFFLRAWISHLFSEIVSMKKLIRQTILEYLGVFSILYNRAMINSWIKFQPLLNLP